MKNDPEIAEQTAANRAAVPLAAIWALYQRHMTLDDVLRLDALELGQLMKQLATEGLAEPARMSLFNLRRASLPKSERLSFIITMSLNDPPEEVARLSPGWPLLPHLLRLQADMDGHDKLPGKEPVERRLRPLLPHKPRRRPERPSHAVCRNPTANSAASKVLSGKRVAVPAYKRY